MRIAVTTSQIEVLWEKARRATEEDSPFAEGVYATLQWLTGDGDEPDLE